MSAAAMTPLFDARTIRHRLNGCLRLSSFRGGGLFLRLSRRVYTDSCDAGLEGSSSALMTVMVVATVVSRSPKTERSAGEQCKHECFVLSASHRYGPLIGGAIRRFVKDASWARCSSSW